MNICIFTGYIGFTQRTNNIAKFINRDFPNIKISTIVFGRPNYDFLIRQNYTKYEEVTCIEHIMEEIDKKNILVTDDEIKKMEEYLQCSLTHLAYSERTFVQHTHNLNYERRLSQSEIIKFTFLLIKKLDELTKNSSIIFTYTSASLVSEILFHLCKVNNKKYLTLNETRLAYRWSITENNIDYHEKIHNYYKSSKITNEGKILIDKYIQNLKLNIKNEIEMDYQKKIIDTKRLNFKNIMRFTINFFKDNKYDAFFLVPNRYQRVYENILIKIREKFDGLYLQKSLPEEKYVYFPLSLIPEASTLIRGQRYYDPLSLIKSVSRQLPINWKLVVREHPSMRARNPLKFYKDVSRLHNVHLTSYQLDATKCIINSEAVITITGTTGLESLALGKKTIILGEAIYKILSSVIKLSNLDELTSILRKKMTLKDIDDQLQDMYKFGTAILEGSSITDENKILWTKKAFQIEEDIVDVSIFEQLKKDYLI